MPGWDEEKISVALGEVRGKRPAKGRSPRFCGDIGLKIARDGNWSYQGSPIGRKPLVKLFASVLRREQDGRYYLVTPVETVLVEVEDAPFLAVEMTVEGKGAEQRLSFRTNLDDDVVADLAHPLRFRRNEDGSFTPYLQVREVLEARLARPVYYDLVGVAVTGRADGKRTLGVWSAGSFFPFPEASGAGEA